MSNAYDYEADQILGNTYKERFPPLANVEEAPKGWWGKTKDWITGDGTRIEGIPELFVRNTTKEDDDYFLNDYVLEKAQRRKAEREGKKVAAPKESFRKYDIEAQMALGRDDASMLDILESNLGEQVQAERDRAGRVIVTFTPEQAQRLGVENDPRAGYTRYLNAPGISLKDAEQLGTQMLFEGAGVATAGTLTANLARKAVSRRAAKSLGAASGLGAGYLAQDFAAQKAGSKQGTDGLGLLITMAAGGTLEWAAPSIRNGLRKLANKRYIRIGKTGEVSITDEGLEAISRETGTDVDTLKEGLPDNFKDVFNKELEKVGKGGEDIAAVQAIRKAGPGGEVPLTRGQTTRNRKDLMLENQMRTGVYGDEAQAAAEALDNAQQEALRRNLSKIDQKISGRNSVGPEGDELAIGGPTDLTKPRKAIIKREAGERAKIERLYNEAEAAGGKIKMDRARGFNQSIRAMLKKEGYAEGTISNDVRASLNQLDSMMAQGDGVSVVAMERWVQSLNRKIRSAQGTDKYILGQMRKQYGKFMDRAADGWIVGNSKAISKFKQARAARKQYAQVFEDDPKLMKIIESDELGQMRLDDNEALEVLFTKNGAGLKQGSHNTIKRMKVLLGENSPEWADFKGNVFRRMLISHKYADEYGSQMSRAISGDRFNTALQQLKANKQAYETIFSANERVALEQFAKIARRVTHFPGSKGNPSRTADNLLVAAVNIFRWKGASNLVAALRGVLSKTFEATGVKSGVRSKAAYRQGFVDGGYVPGQEWARDSATGKLVRDFTDQDAIWPLGLERLFPNVENRVQPDMMWGLFGGNAASGLQGQESYPGETYAQRMARLRREQERERELSR